MATKKERAELMKKLLWKKEFGGNYSNITNFKRFENLKDIIKELSKKGWLLVHKGEECISLNPKYQEEIIESVRKQLPEANRRLDNLFSSN